MVEGAYLDAIMGLDKPQEEPQPSRWLGPIRWLGDKLSRGEHVTANLIGRPLFRGESPRLINPFWESPEDKLTFGQLVGETGFAKEHPYLGAIGGLGADIAGDPLSWIGGVGTLSKLGRGAELGTSMLKAGKTAEQILPGVRAAAEAVPWYRPFKAAKTAADVGAVEEWLARGAPEFGKTWAEQAAKGHRSLVGVGLPWQRYSRPLIGGKIAEKVFAGGGAVARPVQSWLFKHKAAIHTGNPDLDALIDQHYLDMKKRGVDVEETVKPFAEGAATLSPQQKAELADTIAGGRSLDPDVQNLVGQWDKLTGGAGARDIAAGRLAPEQVAVWKGRYEAGIPGVGGKPVFEELYPRKQAAPSQFGAGAKEYTESLGRYERGRARPEGQSIPEFNAIQRERLAANPALAAKAGIRTKPWEFWKPKLENVQILEEDPVVRLQHRLMATAKAEAGTEFLNNVKNQFSHGVLPDPADKQAFDAAFWEMKGKNPDLVDLKFGDEYHMVPSEVARVVERVKSIHDDPEALTNAILGTVNHLSGYWKMAVLANPGTVLRNFFSNIVQSGVGDGFDMENAVRALSGKLADINAPSYGRISAADQMLKARQYGIMDISLPEALHKEIPTAYTWIGKKFQWMPEQIGKINRGLENRMRLGHFITRLEAGDTYEQAAQSVGKYLYDYSRTSPMGQKWFRMAIPFGRWYVRNVPRQVANIAMYPAKHTVGLKVIDAVSHALVNKPPDEQFMAEYLKDEMGVPVKDNGDGTYNYVLLGRWLPIGDLIRIMPWGSSAWRSPGDFIKKGISEVMQQMLGGLRAPGEALLNQSPMIGEIEKYPGQPGYLAGIKGLVSRRWAHAIEGVAPWIANVPVAQFSRFSMEREKGRTVPGAALAASLGAKTYLYNPERGKYIEQMKLARLRSNIKHDIDQAQRMGSNERTIAQLQAKLVDVENKLQALGPIKRIPRNEPIGAGQGVPK